MSLTGKLISAAVTAGTALAVGYGLKKLGEKVESELNPPEINESDESEILGTAKSKISLFVGDGNDWSYTMKNKGIVKESENKLDSTVHKFDFVPLKDGVTELEFDYKPKGSDKPNQTITYNIEVKNGKIIRCNAAGDLQMIDNE